MMAPSPRGRMTDRSKVLMPVSIALYMPKKRRKLEGLRPGRMVPRPMRAPPTSQVPILSGRWPSGRPDLVRMRRARPKAKDTAVAFR